MDLQLGAAVTPVEVLIGGAGRSATDLVVAQIDPISLQTAVVLQLFPGEWDVFLAHAEKAAETQDRIGDLAAQLVDHQALNGADLTAVWAPHHGALDPIAGDQAVCLGSCG